jgi:hypothetical protein
MLGLSKLAPTVSNDRIPPSERELLASAFKRHADIFGPRPNGSTEVHWTYPFPRYVKDRQGDLQTPHAIWSYISKQIRKEFCPEIISLHKAINMAHLVIRFYEDLLKACPRDFQHPTST